MNIAVLTIFPQLFDAFWNNSIVGRAVGMGKLKYTTYSIRDFASGRHKTTDDRPYGGGCGMLMKPEPIVSAVKAAKRKMPLSSTVFLSPQGKKLDQRLVSHLMSLDDLILVCGRYEGIDERALDLVDFEVSIGDYVLTGGELAAMVLIDSMTRLIPGVLGNPNSTNCDTFSAGSNGLVEHAQYTRPRMFEGMSVPEVLFSGNHCAVEQWRLETSLIRTLLKRKELLEDRHLSLKEINVLDKWRLDIEKIIQRQSVRGISSPSST